MIRRRSRTLGPLVLGSLLIAALLVTGPAATRAQDRDKATDAPKAKSPAAQTKRSDAKAKSPAAKAKSPQTDRPEARHLNKTAPAARKLTADDVPEIIVIMKDRDPALAKRFEKMFKSDPKHAIALISERGQRLRYLLDLKRNDPDLYALRTQDLQVSRQLRALTDQVQKARKAKDEKAAKDGIEELRTVLAQQFEVRQQIRTHELKKLEARIAHIHKQLDEERSAKADLIERQLRKLLRSDESANKSIRTSDAK